MNSVKSQTVDGPSAPVWNQVREQVLVETRNRVWHGCAEIPYEQFRHQVINQIRDRAKEYHNK